MPFYDPKPLGESTREILSRVATATLTSQLFKLGLRTTYMQHVRPINPAAARFVGPAYTMRMVPAREDIAPAGLSEDPEHPHRKCIEGTPPGHVLVLDAHGDTRGGVVGDILVERLKVRGVAGYCSDGGVRDTVAMLKQGFPVFCQKSTAPAAMPFHHAMDLQLPIGCGGVTVLPGDIMVGDPEGVVVIPSNVADQVAEGAAEQELMEEFVFERVHGGAHTIGIYPPDEKRMAEYAAWKKARD